MELLSATVAAASGARATNQWGTSSCTHYWTAHLFDAAAHGRVADVGVDLGEEPAADDGGLHLQVAPVGRDDGTPPSHLHTARHGSCNKGSVVATALGTDKHALEGMMARPRATCSQFGGGQGCGMVFVIRGDTYWRG